MCLEWLQDLTPGSKQGRNFSRISYAISERRDLWNGVAWQKSRSAFTRPRAHVSTIKPLNSVVHQTAFRGGGGICSADNRQQRNQRFILICLSYLPYHTYLGWHKGIVSEWRASPRSRGRKRCQYGTPKREVESGPPGTGVRNSLPQGALAAIGFRRRLAKFLEGQSSRHAPRWPNSPSRLQGLCAGSNPSDSRTEDQFGKGDREESL